jgi:exodeoxyribonuclease X
MTGPIFLVLDVETTGADPFKDGVCEVGFCATTQTEQIDAGALLVDPGVPISPEASAVHHMIDEDVAGQPVLADVLAAMAANWPVWGEAQAYVAHNAPFDKAFLPSLAGARPWIDTYRAAKRYLPELPKHSNQFLRYALKLDVPRDAASHRALGDAIVTAALLRHLLAGPAREDFERLGVAAFAAHVDSPLLLTMVAFGKHQGKRWADVPRDYLQWMLRQQPGFDPDITYTAEHYLSL